MTSISIDIEFDKVLKETDNSNLVPSEMLAKHNAYAVFSYGSKILENKYIESASKCPELNIIVTRSINNDASVFIAECIALKDALKIALKCSNKDIFMCSDSPFILQSLQNIKFNIITDAYIL